MGLNVSSPTASIKRMCEIQPLDVAAAQPAEIADANAVRNRADTLIDDISDRRRPHQETVVVVMDAGIVFVPRANKFRGVTGKEKILNVDIAEDHLLVAPRERIQAAVGVFLEKMK